MDRGIVMGTLWATRKVPALAPFKLVLVRKVTHEGKSTDEVIVAADTIDTSPGEHILLAYGSGARNCLGDQKLPIEAAVVGIIDENRPADNLPYTS